LQKSVTPAPWSTLAFAAGVAIGLALLVLRVGGGAVARWVVATYVSAIRGTPLLIQLLIAYYVIPGVLDVTISPIAAG
ncbi:ABC transporter permease subunit, partial [Xylella fastidiosa subsp. multiplex]|nr:ABC transporter permease subunit [Xylella fastidiosa subsp. multiplex]